MDKKNQKKDKKGDTQQTAVCETCEFFEDGGYGEVTCLVNLDEDEFADFAAGHTGTCPYYRFYDEYKTVQKQN